MMVTSIQIENNKLEKIVEDIHIAWDEALSKNDVEALLALYSNNAIIESPLIPHLLKTDRGVCEGKEELRKLLLIVAERKPTKRQYYKKNYFTDGKTVMWEYPRQSPTGEQMDFIEVMEIENGLIQRHRVYWGWFGFNVLKNDEYH